MTYQYDKGYLIPAVGDVYVDCARTLAKSLRHWHPDAKICLLTDSNITDPLFDIVVGLPHGDRGGWANDWQAYESSPFHETVKLEADMIVSGPIDHYWELFRHRDLVISVGCRDHKNKPSTVRRYRKVFDDNNLLDTYNALTYWRVSRSAKNFFDTVKTMFDRWDEVKFSIRGGQEQVANTDLIYAMAAEFLGRDQFWLPGSPTIVHMKPSILGIQGQDWTHEMVWELIDGEFRVNGYSQTGLVHYNQKDLAIILERCYD